MRPAILPMSVRSTHLTAAVCLLLSLAGLVACGQRPAATAPAPNLPPSVAPVATATAPAPDGPTSVVEPSAAATTAPTFVVPSAAAVPNATLAPTETLRAALDHTRALDRYSIHVLFDAVTTLPDGRMEHQINTELTGTFDRADASYVLNDRAFNYPGTDLPSNQLAVITLGGRTYLQGPLRLPTIVPPI